MWGLHWRAVQLEGSLTLAGTVFLAPSLAELPSFQRGSLTATAGSLDTCQSPVSSPDLFSPVSCYWSCLLAGSPQPFAPTLAKLWNEQMVLRTRSFQIYLDPQVSGSFSNLHISWQSRKIFFSWDQLLPRTGPGTGPHLPSSCPHSDRVLSHPSTLSCAFAALPS